MAIKNQDYIKNLIRELISLPSETEWVEFKHNNDEPQMIGEYISALGNSAALLGRPKAYMLWGIDDETHKIVEYVLTIIPQEETIEGSIRRSNLGYPEIAIRELIANIMIHQAIDQKGTNPMVELFKDRIEFSNAGSPLVSIERIVDTVPISRNENLAGFMHKCGICEERGSGYDKVIYATSKNSMLAPKIENQSDKFTRVTLFLKVPFDLISKEDRVRTCYMQTCFLYVNGEAISNNSVRELFGIDEKDKYKASRIIKDTLEAKFIKPVNENTAPRYMKYIPFWA